MALDIGLPVEKLRQQIKDTLAGKSEREEVVLEATNRRGKTFNCRVTFLPLGSGGDGNVAGAIMMMEDVAS
jgi:two-component system CheB/CheR fusion protein